MKVLLKSVLVVSKDELQKNDIFTLEDVTAPEGLSFPKKGVTFYYGFKESVVNISVAIQKAAEEDMEVHPVDVVLDVKRNTDATLSLSELPNCTFLNVSRIKKDIYDIIKVYIETYIQDNSLVQKTIELEIWDENSNTITTKGIQIFIMQYPYIIDYIWEQKEFNHLDVIVYPVLEGLRKSSRATLFKSKNVVKNEYGTPFIEILAHPEKVVLLPSFLED